MGSLLDYLVQSLRAAPSAKPVVLDRGDTLINQGDESNAVFLLVNGSLQVSRDLDEVTAVIANIDEPGSIVGEMVAIGGGRRTATVTATEASELIAVEVSDFDRLLAEDPDLADLLVHVAIRRAEEGELAELLANHFGMVDEDTLIATCSSVRWHRLTAGEVLFSEGDASDSVYFVVRGRLTTTRADPAEGVEGEIKVGELGRGDVVGEVGLLQHRPRSGTVTASRDTVVAEMSEQTFLGLIDKQPRMMVELFLDALARSKSPRWHSAPSTVLGVLVGPGVSIGPLVDGIETELSRFGEVRRLSRELVEASLAHPGIASSEPGGLEEVRLSRFIHETELAADFVVIDVGNEPDHWARRALGMVEQLLVFVGPGTSAREVGHLEAIAGTAGRSVARTLVIVGNDSEPPTGSASLRQALAAGRVLHVRVGHRDDVARLARVAVGRSNALVLSGGGGRGFAHIGVYRALIELGFPLDMVAGSSMGAVLGAAVADRSSPEEVVAWAEDRFADSLDYTIPIVSLVKGERITSYARERFGERDIEDLRLTYFAVSTDLTTSRAHVHDTGSVVLAIRATSAIPGVMPPVPYGDALLVDGGVLNNLPVDVARIHSPLGRLVASDVAPPRGPGAHGDYGLSASGWQALRSRWRGGGAAYPRMSAVLMRSMITASMRERDAQIHDGLADCYLDLDIRGVSMLEFDTPRAVAARGYDAAMPILEAWLEDLSSDRDAPVAERVAMSPFVS
ncbi:MAG TPA: cyclic nucleotide-binding domain-containing protein [Acidimicrobiia bacterium]